MRWALTGGKIGERPQVVPFRSCVIDVKNRRDRTECGHSFLDFCQSWLCTLDSVGECKPLV